MNKKITNSCPNNLEWLYVISIRMRTPYMLVQYSMFYQPNSLPEKSNKDGIRPSLITCSRNMQFLSEKHILFL
jgi:hypothetical protein